MAGQNIVIAGATFNAVPSIVVPTSGGGAASFVDTSDASATASDIASGKTAYVNGELVTGTGSGGVSVEALSVTANGTYTAPTGTAYSPVTVNVSGGGTVSASPNDVNFIDYDGTIVYSYSAADFANLTELPANPSHTGLTAQGWNWTLADAKAYVAAYGGLDIGQMYVTDDDKTRLYCRFSNGRLHPYLGICPKGTVTVDWGDGSATETMTGTSLTTTKYLDHEYASEGDYVITLAMASGTFAFYGQNNFTNLLKRNTTTTSANNHVVYSAAVYKIELGSAARIGDYGLSFCQGLKSITMHRDVTIGSYAFRLCYGLASVVIPSGITSIGTYAFYFCVSMAIIAISSSVTSIGSYAFRSCYSLASVVIPSGVTSIGSYAFQYCTRLVSIIVPSSVTSIGTYAFQYCNVLVSIVVPSGVTSIGIHTFGDAYGMAAYHFLRTTPPTLANINAFANIQTDCVIYVPYSEDHSILAAYQAATNWSTYASYMQEEPQ